MFWSVRDVAMHTHEAPGITIPECKFCTVTIVQRDTSENPMVPSPNAPKASFVCIWMTKHTYPTWRTPRRNERHIKYPLERKVAPSSFLGVETFDKGFGIIYAVLHSVRSVNSTYMVDEPVPSDELRVSRVTAMIACQCGNKGEMVQTHMSV
jgi:hypothetical protein